MKPIFSFGETVKGYDIPVLNEREIRAAAGILFVFMFLSIMLAILQAEFLMLKFALTLFMTDMLIRVLLSPRFSPSLILGRFVVRKQTPEYVGAAQKKFAWIIGVVLSVTIFFHLVVFNGISPITGVVCMICLLFLFFETAFGICLGCKFYSLVYKNQAQYCPGEVCELKDRQDIQKISRAQYWMLFAFVVYTLLIITVFHDTFSQMPNDIFGIGLE
ncbi:MAG: DUF4395 domain-containing protein [Gammaproteobacteria bacterium]|nr:DUF4395 domain-containing protein [Gammaproteobacteria bacterium]